MNNYIKKNIIVMWVVRTVGGGTGSSISGQFEHNTLDFLASFLFFGAARNSTLLYSRENI